jgi:hypothetical protein
MKTSRRPVSHSIVPGVTILEVWREWRRLGMEGEKGEGKAGEHGETSGGQSGFTNQSDSLP